MNEHQQLDTQVQSSKEHDKPIAVAVVTPSGTFPDDDDYRRASSSDVIADILHLASQKLKLTNTADWVAFVNDKEVDVTRTFKDSGLHDIVEIEWHKREGGGGA